MASFLALACMAEARAEPIVYTVSVNGSGTLDGTSFGTPTSQLITLTVTTDTNNVQHYPPPMEGNQAGYYVLVGAGSGSVSVSVAGGPSDTFTDSIEVVDVNSGTGAPTFLLYDMTVGKTIVSEGGNSSFATYNLQSALGATAGPIAADTTGQAFGTTNGSLTLNSLSGNVTTMATIPEPSSVVLTGLAGVIALGIARFRGKRPSWRP